MTNEKAKELLLGWCKSAKFNINETVAPRLDNVQYDKFVRYKDRNWFWGTQGEYIAFVEEYANSLTLFDDLGKIAKQLG
jgi:hypothetical protein